MAERGMMTLVFLWCCFLGECFFPASVLRAESEPSAEARMQALLNEAQKDSRAKRYPEALEKFVRYHEESKSVPGHAGVRLSFALMYWNELGKAYPPALERLKEMRDQAGTDVLAADDPFPLFHDYSAINRTLKEEAKTIALFEQLSKQAPEKAKRVYHVAENDLLRAKKYELCNPYIGVDALASHLIGWEHFQRDGGELNAVQKEFLRPHIEKSFSENACTLVALLVINGRREEAEEAAGKARAAWDNPDFHEKLDAALKGELPQQAP